VSRQSSASGLSAAGVVVGVGAGGSVQGLSLRKQSEAAVAAAGTRSEARHAGGTSEVGGAMASVIASEDVEKV
jgi:hypothetical protein